MMRAVRSAAQLDFKIEAATLQAIKDNAPLYISRTLQPNEQT